LVAATACWKEMIATLASTGVTGAEASAVEPAGLGAEGTWPKTMLVDASRHTSVNERFIGIQNSF
jgi:hypothetical protein